MSQELNRDCAICRSLGDICVSCEERAALTQPANDQTVYMVVFDDHDVRPETLIGEAVARRRYKDLSNSWNAHLFVKLDSNSRDDCYAKANYQDPNVTRLQAENAALQQRLNGADQRVDELSAALDTCHKWFTKHSPTAPLIGGFGDAEHPMITLIRGALSAPAAKVDCGNCAFVDGVCSTGCETQRIRAAQQ